MRNIPSIRIDTELSMKLGIKVSAIYGYILDKNSQGMCVLDLDEFLADLPLLHVSKRFMSSSINKLISNNYISRRELTSSDKFELLSGKKMSGLGMGGKECEWCGVNTSVLHKHHYPIQRKDNGKKVVKICPNCHYEFHHLTSELIIRRKTNGEGF